MSKVILHNYFRSSTSYRVRAALNLKGVEYDYAARHLRLGEHRREDFLALNPQGLVPAMVWSDGTVHIQSLAMLEFIDESVPEPPLLPSDAAGRSRVRAIAQMIGCDIHPLNNLRVLNAIRTRFGADEEAVAAWFRHWVAETFAPLEKLLSQSPLTGKFCHGDRVGIADLCLVAQVANNGRFNVDMTPYPTIGRINAAAMTIEAIAAAAPSRQPDAE
jgi:maleylpyruvate isomerase